MEITSVSFEERRAGLKKFLIDTQGNTLNLESGEKLSNVEIGFKTYGKESNKQDRTIYICHSLSADCHLTKYPISGQNGWWPKFVGPGKTIDLNRYFIVCSNFLGGCFGSTGPSSLDKQTGNPYGLRFPLITFKDVVKCKRLLLNHLGIEQLHAIIGGSFGGLQALKFIQHNPHYVKKTIIMSANASVSSFALGINRLARWAIENDSNFNSGDYYGLEPPTEGLALARAIMEHSFITHTAMQKRFARKSINNKPLFSREHEFEISSELVNKGRAFANVFDANTFWYTLKLIDQFNLGNSDQIASEFSEVGTSFLHFAVPTDSYFPASESSILLDGLDKAGLKVERQCLDSEIGHDAFFTDVKQIGKIISQFLEDPS